MAEDTRQYIYSLVEQTATKRGRRAFTPYGRAYELMGVDGGVHGGCGPHYGFKWVEDLEGGAGDEAGGYTASFLADAFPVNFRVGSDESAWGHVYIVWDESNETLKIWLSYRKGTDLTSTRVAIREFTAIPDALDLTYSLFVQGRFVYVFVEGEEPTMFYYDETGGAIVVVENTGAGAQPLLDSYDQMITAVAGSSVVPTDPPNLTTDASVLPLVGTPPAGDEPAQGKVVLVGFVGYAGTYAGSDVLIGPSEMMLWTVTPATQVDPTFVDDYFWTGGLGGLSGTSSTVTRPPSYYTFTYQLFDSRTGRKSQLSQLADLAVGNTDQGPLAINSRGEAVAWALLELVYDSEKFDQLLVYRSTRGEQNSIQHLEALIDLEDYEAADQTGMTGDWKRAYYFYTLIDQILVTQETFQGDLLYDANVPFAGAALLYDGMALYGNIRTEDRQRGGLGYIRWSNAYDVNPEQVAPDNRYSLSGPTEDVRQFVRIGANVLGIGQTELYHIRKENFVVKVTPLQAEYGSPSYRGAVAVGSEAYMVTESGLKQLSTMGDMNNVEVLDSLIREDWKGTVEKVQVAYDAATEVIFVFNPELEKAALLWLTTSAMTELTDMNFDVVREGKVPIDWESSNKNQKKRAVFYQKVNSSLDTSKPLWRVFVTDFQRAKTGRRFLDPTGTVRLSLVTAPGVGGILVVPSGSLSVFGRYEGCRVYVLEGASAGKYATIRYVIDDQHAQMEDDYTNLVGVTGGVRLGISPVYFRWVGHGLAIVQDNPQGEYVTPYNYSQLKHVQSLTCVFSDVSGVASADVVANDARFAAYVYKGNSSVWVGGPTRNFPIHPDGTKVRSVTEGPSVYASSFISSDGGVAGAALFPAVEIICPDLDFALLQVNVLGTIRDSITESVIGPRAL